MTLGILDTDNFDWHCIEEKKDPPQVLSLGKAMRSYTCDKLGHAKGYRGQFGAFQSFRDKQFGIKSYGLDF